MGRDVEVTPEEAIERLVVHTAMEDAQVALECEAVLKPLIAAWNQRASIPPADQFAENAKCCPAGPVEGLADRAAWFERFAAEIVRADEEATAHGGLKDCRDNAGGFYQSGFLDCLMDEAVRRLAAAPTPPSPMQPVSGETEGGSSPQIADPAADGGGDA